VCFNRSDGNKKQHKIFDLIELADSEDEVMESSCDNEIEVVSHENNPVQFSAEGNEQGKALSKQMKHSEGNEKDINSTHTNFFLAKKDLISMIEDVGGKYLFSVRQTCTLFMHVFYIFFFFSILLAFSLVTFPSLCNNINH
jgi:hypothetical protein